MEPTLATPNVVSQYYLKIQALTTADTQAGVQTTSPPPTQGWIPYDTSTALYLFIGLVLVGSLGLLITRARQLNKLIMVLVVSLVTSVIPLALNLSQQQTSLESQANVFNTPQNVIIQDVVSTGFTISWHTDKAQTGVLRIAESPDMQQSSRVISADQVTTDHRIMVDRLTPGTTYYLEVLSGADWYNYDGQPVQITTLAR